MLTPSAPAPEDYYQNNCLTLLSFVLERYSDLLTVDEQTHYRSYIDLSADGQRLVARLLTRKGPLFRIDNLNYREIHSIDRAVTELRSVGLVEINPDCAADQLLATLRKDELVSLDEAFGEFRKQRKQELVCSILNNRSDPQLRALIYQRFDLIHLTYPEAWSLALLLFFGEARGDWSTFVLSDLGRVEYERVPLVSRQFDDRSQLDQTLVVLALNRLSHDLDGRDELAHEVLARLCDISGDRFVARRRDKSILRIAHHLERSLAFEDALSAYGAVSRHPARERQIRLLHKTGQEAEAEALLEQAKATPYSEEESQFCERYRQRNRGFQPETFTVTVDGLDSDQSIEAQALEVLIGEFDVKLGAHVENTLVRSLTGLCYWPVIFLDIPGAFTNPFQVGPNDLYADDFFQARADQIIEFETSISLPGALQEHIRSFAKDKHLKANGLVSWTLFDTLEIEQILAAIPEDHIRALTSFQIRRLPQFRTGLPDLFVVYADGRYEFIEIKGPNDQLQPVQRLWFKHFDQMNVPARVMKIKVA